MKFESVDETFDNIKSILRDEKLLVTDIDFDGVEYKTLIHHMFLLIGVKPNLYYLSSNINNFNIYEMNKFTQILTIALQTNMQVMPEYFYDKDSNDIVFGEKAYTKYKDYLANKNGMALCPICEKPVHKKIWVDDKGWCKVCDEQIVPYLTVH